MIQIDFGEAKQIGKEEEDEIHRSDARGSFVGTYNYMAPETIGNCSTVLESDLWALGCIVFKMATGKIMIPGKQLFQVSPLISNREISWPENLDPKCKDLIDKLVRLDPKERLGAPGTPHDMTALMKHQFFEGIDFNSDLSKLGVKDLLAKTAVEEFSDEEESEIQPEPLNHGIRQEAKQFIEETYGPLSPDAPILIGNLVKQNRYAMKQERRFELYTDGQIKYYQGETQKGLLILTHSSWLKMISKNQAQLHIPGMNKDYIFKQKTQAQEKTNKVSDDLHDWEVAVNKVCQLIAE